MKAWLRAAGLVALFGAVMTCRGATHELIRDPHFQRGFFLLQPEQGQRVVYGQVSGLTPGKPVWDLAQWSSRFPLQLADCSMFTDGLVLSNAAKCVVVGKPGSTAADLALAVNAGAEYLHPRRSGAEPWVHLLVQQEFGAPPSLGSLAAFNFHLEARLKHSSLVTTNDYSPSRHAAQYFVYLTVANRNSKAAGYGECFWFGVPVYDNRQPVVSSYEAQDFGQTKLFIFTPGSDTFARNSTHGGSWVTFEHDLLPLLRQALEHARAKGFIKGSAELADYRALGIFIGWEVPGMFEVELQIRNLSVQAVEPRT